MLATLVFSVVTKAWTIPKKQCSFQQRNLSQGCWWEHLLFFLGHETTELPSTPSAPGSVWCDCSGPWHQSLSAFCLSSLAKTRKKILTVHTNWPTCTKPYLCNCVQNHLVEGKLQHKPVGWQLWNKQDGAREGHPAGAFFKWLTKSTWFPLVRSMMYCWEDGGWTRLKK